MPARNQKEMEIAADAGSLPQSPANVSRLARRESDDADLLRRIAAGDRAAFEALYRRYVRPVFGLALRRLGDRGRAEDATQETFTAVWRAAGSYRPDRGPAAPWLYAVARNAIIDRSRVRGEPSAEPPEEAADEPGPPERAESGWVAWQVHSALEKLPEQERSLIELAYWGGLSQSEIAEFVGIPLGTVKTRTRSALARLADALDEGVR